MPDWLLLHYKLPAQPSALRVYIWRKLKRLGAILIQDAIWILPDTARTAEQFQWLVAEIQELQGEALFWKAELVLGVQETALKQLFMDEVDRQYEALFKKLNQKNPDLPGLSRQYQQIFNADYFHSERGARVRERLLALRGAKG